MLHSYFVHIVILAEDRSETAWLGGNQAGPREETRRIAETCTARDLDEEHKRRRCRSPNLLSLVQLDIWMHASEEILLVLVS